MHVFVFVIIITTTTTTMGRNKSVGIATCYGLDDPRIESLRGRDFPHPYTPVLGPSQPPIQWYRRLSGRGMVLITHTHLRPRLRKE